MKNIKAIIFDLDDTLILEADYIRSGFKHISYEIEKKFNLGKDKIFNEMMYYSKKKENNIFNKVLDKHNIDYSNDFISRLVFEYRNHNPNISLLSDASKLLDYLIKSNFKTGVITDGNKLSQNNKIKKLKLENLIDEIIINDEYGKKYWKPNPYSYKLMKTNLKCEFNEMIYIGDNPKKDFISAKKLGYKTFRVIRNRGIYKNLSYKNKYRADFQISNLTEIIKLLRGIK